MPPSWHPVPACVRHGHSAGGQFLPVAAMVLQAGRSSLQQRWRCRLAVLSCSSDGAAAIPKSGLEIKNHCTLETVNRQKLASIRKSGLEIKNRCTQEGLNGEIPASIRKSEPKIRNHCSRETVSRQKPAVIPKSGLEIKNHCSRLISFSRGNTSEVPRFGGTGQGREFRRGGLCG